MKKITLYILLISLFSSSYAHASLFQSCSPFHGFYVGAGLGLAINMADVNSDQTISFVQGGNVIADERDPLSAKLYKNNIYGSVFGGIGAQFCTGLHLGVRVGVNASRFDIKHEEGTRKFFPSEAPGNAFIVTQDVVSNMRLRTFEYTLDGRVGWLLTQKTLLFGLLGMAWNKKKLDTTGTAGLDQIVNNVLLLQILDSLASSSSDANVFFRWGVGIEQMLCGCLAFEILYTHTNYGRLSTNGISEKGVGTDNSLLISQSYNILARLKRHTLTAGLVYHF